MWHLIDSSPILAFLFVLYVIYLVAVLIFLVTLSQDCERRRNAGQPAPPVDHQEFLFPGHPWHAKADARFQALSDHQDFLSPGPRWGHVESDRRFARVPYSCYVNPDRRLWAVHHGCSPVYASMLADASEKIRLK
jgi:hypothetical protein